MIIIYDDKGTIWYNGDGMGVPSGLPYLDVDIPRGFYIDNVDISSNPPKPVFKAYGKMKLIYFATLLQN